MDVAPVVYRTITVRKILLNPAVILSFSAAAAQVSEPASALSEQDFLAPMPIVLSVSRLAQRLDETPGAMTILDRDFIRMTGARDVVDVLRLVPGFQSTTSFETDAPMASYHGRSTGVANKIQVLVDGRSVYSGFLTGSTGLGWQTLAIDDIERIEVLRGSNSAAYGARAFLGVVNIVSRDVADTRGTAVSAATGENGVADGGVRLGWGEAPRAFRISADSRSDSGLRKLYANGGHAAGDNRVDRVHFSSHFVGQGGAETDLRAGAVNTAATIGDSGSPGNAERTRFLNSRFLQWDWRTVLSPDQDIAITASHTENSIGDRFVFLDDNYKYALGGIYYGTTIELEGQEANDAVSFQHTLRPSDAWALVWGAELRRETIVSVRGFDARGRVSNDFWRLFSSAQWRLAPQWLLNLGALAEHSDLGGDSVSPRAILNWHAAPGHTLRAGVSTAFRPPSAYEKYVGYRFYDVNGQNPTPLYVQGNPALVSETVEVRELGYLADLPHWGLSADVRIFSERVDNGIAQIQGSPIQYANGDRYEVSGAEYQVTWRPARQTRIFFSQSWLNTDVQAMAYADEVAHFALTHGAPRYTASLAAMHTLANGLTLTVTQQRAHDYALTSSGDGLHSMQRTDLRVAKPVRLGGAQAEWAVTVQNLDAPYQDGNSQFFFDRRALVSLRIHY